MSEVVVHRAQRGEERMKDEWEAVREEAQMPKRYPSASAGTLGDARLCNERHGHGVGPAVERLGAWWPTKFLVFRRPLESESVAPE